MVSKFQKIWMSCRWEILKILVYHWVVGHISAKSAKYQLLIAIHCACNLFSPHQILTVGGEYIQVLKKFSFIKKYVFLRKLLTLRKCIIGWWCIISRWMTVNIFRFFGWLNSIGEKCTFYKISSCKSPFQKFQIIIPLNSR